MKSKDVQIGMKVVVHDISWPRSSMTFEQYFSWNPGRKIFIVKKWSHEDRCWVLNRLDRGGQLWVLSKDFEPYIEEGENKQ